MGGIVLDPGDKGGREREKNVEGRSEEELRRRGKREEGREEWKR